MSSGSYSLLEQGKSLPGDAITFFTLICDCLAVKPNSKYRPLLLYQYLYDSAIRSIGAAFAVRVVKRGAPALRALCESAALGITEAGAAADEERAETPSALESAARI
jgi:hypothetical protein